MVFKLSIFIEIFRNDTSLMAFKRDVLSLVYRLINYPRNSESTLLGKLYHDVNAGSATSRKIFTKKEENLIQKSKNIDHFLINSKFSDVHWPQGLISKFYPDYYFEQNLLFKNELSASFLLKKVVHKCASEDFNEVIIYGAGESCLSVLKFCRISNLKSKFHYRCQATW